MQTQVLQKTETKVQKIQLVKGAFTPSEAFDVVSALIDEKINFHKIQRLQRWEGDHNCSTNQLDGRIEELAAEKQTAREFINSLRAQGKKLSINGVLEITVSEE